MLYTRKGDGGTTKTFGCDQRISKSSKITEALGNIDEVNSFVGFLRASLSDELKILDRGVKEMLLQIQEDLFIIQAELAGADKHLNQSKVAFLENFVDEVEKNLPKIDSFFIAGGDIDSALCDVVRTVVRRAERRVVDVSEENKVVISKEILMYLNRLSSFFYALERWVNKEKGISEKSPKYE